MSAELDGFAALVTGGRSGIGLATARLLRERGASVGVLDITAGPELYEAGVDVRDDAGVRAAVQEVVARFGRLDIVVNCAGIGAAGAVGANPDDEWHTVFDVNVLGIVRVVRAALPQLRRSEAASVVNVSSVAATVGLPLRALYSASKGAVSALTRAMAADHLPDRIRVNCVEPGTADTPWVARLLSQTDDPDGELRALSARQPIGRLVSADEVARAIAYLAGPGSGSTTGTALPVDGAMASVRVPASGEPTPWPVR